MSLRKKKAINFNAVLVAFLWFFSMLNAAESDIVKSPNSHMETAEIVIFKNLDEMKLEKPPRFQKIYYDRAYLNTLHIPGSFDYPYETNMTFKFEKDTGKPTAHQAINPLQITVSIQGTWTNAEQDLQPKVFLPLHINLAKSLRIVNYEKSLDMQKVVFDYNREEAELDNIEKRFYDRNDVYIRSKGDQIIDYMICDKVNAVRVPHCDFRLFVDPFTADVRFRRELLSEYSHIRKQAEDFITNLLNND